MMRELINELRANNKVMNESVNECMNKRTN